MSARDTLIGILRQWAEHHDAAPITPEALVDASDAELLREWAAKIREVGTAKGWSTWAAAFMDPDTEFVDTAMPSTETIVAELRRLDRIATLRDAADWFERACPDVEALLPVCMCHAATELRGLADRLAGEKDTNGDRQSHEGGSTPAAEPEPLVVARYDTAIEPAPEEEPVLTVGAVGEDGRPVALLFDPETRRKVADWLAPDAAEFLAHAASFEVPWPGYWRPLLLQRSYAGGDRWWIGDREGRRWHRQLGFVYERQDDERTRTDTRFPLAEAWSLAQQIAASDSPARATRAPEGDES